MFEQLDQKQDFSHVLDYCSQLSELRVQGDNKFFKKSNIIPNQLPFNFSSFKSLRKLVLNDINCNMIEDWGDLRTMLKTLEVYNSHILNLSEFLMCDQVHKNEIDLNGPHIFTNLVEANFSNNKLIGIDKSVQLLPNVESLTFESNKIDQLEFLNSLIKLKYLNLSENCFKSTENLELKLCKIVYLDLSQNQLTSLKEFSKLYSLETLNVSGNKIKAVDQVKHISKLPCLENLLLTGNPVSIVVDYRVKVLELFGSRASEICLDNEKPNQKELDKVAVLQAIRIAKEGKLNTVK